MFTGIIETLATVRHIERAGSNIHFTVESPLSDELHVDQSVSHDGVCLTVTAVEAGRHCVTAVEETLQRTRLGEWKEGALVNLERCLPLGGRLDGHLVQGHVDAVAVCTDVQSTDGSWRFYFRYTPSPVHLLVDKGSVCLNGVSLTVVQPVDDTFSVAIIPYTWEHTNFKTLKPGDTVNIEFDIVGKYIGQYLRSFFENSKNPFFR